MNIELSENNSKKLEQEIQSQMLKQIDHFKKEISKLRTGRANPNMIEDVKVPAYGTLMPLKELGAISAPESHTLMIQPWDKGLIQDIERALSSSELGFSPKDDGANVYIKLPPMSQDRRKDLIKILGTKLEETKVGIRNVRKSIQNFIREQQKSKTISEDFSKKLQDLLQKITNDYTDKAQEISESKEVEIKG